MENIGKMIDNKRALLPIVGVALLVIIAALIIAVPHISLSMASSGYAAHSTYLVYDLTEEAGEPIELEKTATLTAEGNPKITDLVYYPGSEQMVFGVTGKASAIEKTPFVFRIRTSAGEYLEFNVAASRIEKYWGNRLMPFYLNRVPLVAGTIYVLEVFAGEDKQSEITFAMKPAVQ